LHPAAARARIALHTAFIPEPEFHVGIGAQPAQFFQKHFSFCLILPLWPGLGHAQMKVQFVQPAQRGAVAQLYLELCFEIAVEFDAGPMNLVGLGGIFQDRQEQIAHALKFDFARAAGSGLGDQRIDAAAVEPLNPQAHHAIGAAELLADRGARDTQQQGTSGGQAKVRAFVGRDLHRHTQFLERGVFRIGKQFR